MVKKNTSQLFGMPKFVSLRGRTSGSFEDWRNFGDPEKLDNFFLNWGSHFFYTTFWQIFRLNKKKKSPVRLGPSFDEAYKIAL